MLNELIQQKSSEQSKSITFRAREGSCSFGTEYLSTIKTIAKSYANKNIRICFHEEGETNLHQMLIYERANVYYPPHCHDERDEMHFVLEGTLEVHIVDEKGMKLESHKNAEKSKRFTILTAGRYH